MRDSRLTSTEFYEYTNVNPRGKICEDCVIRAVALATGESWESTIRQLTELGIKRGYVCNDSRLYPEYLKLKGFVEMKEPRDCCNRKMTIKDFLIMHEGEPFRTMVVNAGSHHVICIKDNKVRDIWNSSRQTMHKYWIKVK